MMNTYVLPLLPLIVNDSIFNALKVQYIDNLLFCKGNCLSIFQTKPSLPPKYWEVGFLTSSKRLEGKTVQPRLHSAQLPERRRYPSVTLRVPPSQ